MSGPRVEIDGGAGFDMLVSAVAVADRDWADVMLHGQDVSATVRRVGGPGLVRDVARFGRFGWINLVGLLAAERSGASVADLAAVLERTPAEELRFVVAGGRRSQLLDRLGADGLRAALAGSTDGVRNLARTLRTPGTLLDVAPWVRRTGSAELKDVLCRAVVRWPDLPVPPTRAADVSQMRDRLERLGGPALLAEVTPGIRYEPGVLQRVVLVGSALVEPVLIAVDEPDTTVIVHPPIRPDGMPDAASDLRRLGDALGDQSRILVLQVLRAGPATLADLCARLGRPRTTLLHHLALLRAGGLVSLTVTAGAPNVYRLDPAGFERLARSARGFVIESSS